nr:transposase [Serinibacter salmoneus]
MAAFHVVKSCTQVVDEVRRRVQQATLGHRGRKGDPSTASTRSCGPGRRTSPPSSGPPRHRDRGHPVHEEVYTARRCAQDL